MCDTQDVPPHGFRVLESASPQPTHRIELLHQLLHHGRHRASAQRGLLLLRLEHGSTALRFGQGTHAGAATTQVGGVRHPLGGRVGQHTPAARGALQRVRLKAGAVAGALNTVYCVSHNPYTH